MADLHTQIERVVKDFVRARSLVEQHGPHGDDQTLNIVAACLVLAARVEAIEDALVEGLPTAGEGI